MAAQGLDVTAQGLDVTAQDLDVAVEDRDTVPPYSPPIKPVGAGWMTITLDRTGMIVKKLPQSDSTPLYYLNKTLLNVNVASSVHVKRAEGGVGAASSLDVWAIGDRYMTPLHTHKKIFREILVARSQGLLVWTRIREIVWDFSTRVPLKAGEAGDNLSSGQWTGPSDAVALVGVDIGKVQGTRRQQLYHMFGGQWIGYENNDKGELIALEREGGAECEGMPVLSVQKELSQDSLDFLVAAWLVTLWGGVGKRVRRLSKSPHN